MAAGGEISTLAAPARSGPACDAQIAGPIAMVAIAAARRYRDRICMLLSFLFGRGGDSAMIHFRSTMTRVIRARGSRARYCRVPYTVQYSSVVAMYFTGTSGRKGLDHSAK